MRWIIEYWDWIFPYLMKNYEQGALIAGYRTILYVGRMIPEKSRRVYEDTRQEKVVMGRNARARVWSLLPAYWKSDLPYNINMAARMALDLFDDVTMLYEDWKLMKCVIKSNI